MKKLNKLDCSLNVENEIAKYMEINTYELMIDYDLEVIARITNEVAANAILDNMSNVDCIKIDNSGYNLENEWLIFVATKKVNGN